MLAHRVQLLVEMQQLLLQGIEAPQADLALLPAQPLLLLLLQALLLCLPQLQVENLEKGLLSYLSLRGSWPSLPTSLRPMRATYFHRWTQSRKGLLGSVTRRQERGQVFHDCLPELTLRAGYSPTPKPPLGFSQALTFALWRCSAFSFSCCPRASLELNEQQQGESVRDAYLFLKLSVPADPPSISSPNSGLTSSPSFPSSPGILYDASVPSVHQNASAVQMPSQRALAPSSPAPPATASGPPAKDQHCSQSCTTTSLPYPLEYPPIHQSLTLADARGHAIIATSQNLCSVTSLLWADL